MDLIIKSVLTGIFFGTWPLLISRSGLNGNAASIVLATGMFVCFLPFSAGIMADIFNSDVRWFFVIGAIVFSSAGILLMNGMLAKTTPQTVSSPLIVIFIVQIVVPSVYYVFVTGGLTLAKGVGFVLAIIAAILLNL